MRCIQTAALVLLCILGTAVVAFAHDEADDRPRVATGDKIRIIALQPSGPVTSGVETKFTIEIEAELHSAKEGIARVWFNLKSPTGYRSVERRDLHEGRQRITFAVIVTPVDWADRGHFTMVINMGSKATDAEWVATAFAQKTISVKR
ncbi:MAG: hypothetical protein WBW99_17910 [Pseudolabrys sp.]